MPRRALGTRSWDEAESLKRRLEAGRGEPVTITQAASDFRVDIDRRKLSPETIRKYKSLLKDLEDFALRAGIRRLDSVSVSDARRFVTEWKLGPNTAARQIERLRTFFRFCLETRWIDHNPARDIRPPKVRIGPTLPFSAKETEKILVACEPRLQALVLLMRYRGLRKQDAACLAKDRITDGRLMLYTAKTGTPVYLPLPPTVIKALESIPHSSSKYSFFGRVKGHPKPMRVSGTSDSGRCFERSAFRTATLTASGTPSPSSCC